jgi:hypothetical protein
MLFGFRRQHPVLQTGEQQNIFVDDSAFAFVRAQNTHKGCSGSGQEEKMERFLIVVNNSDQPRQLSMNTQETAAEGCTQFIAVNGSASEVQPQIDGTVLHTLLGPHGFELYRLR